MWYHKRPLPLPIGKADSIIRFYYACLRVNSVYTCIPYVTNKPNAADSFKWRTAFFPSYILTFIEIEIDITTGSHQLKMRFLFAIVYKNGLFQILGFSSKRLTKKKKKKKKLGIKTWNVGYLSEILPRTSRLFTPTNHSHAKPRSIQNVHKRSFWFSIRGVRNAHLL